MRRIKVPTMPNQRPRTLRSLAVLTMLAAMTAGLAAQTGPGVSAAAALAGAASGANAAANLGSVPLVADDGMGQGLGPKASKNQMFFKVFGLKPSKT